MLEMIDILNHPEFGTATAHINNIDSNINGRMCYGEHSHILYILKEILNDSFVNYLEIGTMHGGSMALALQSKYGKKHIGIDIFSSTGENIDSIDKNQTPITKDNAKLNIDLFNVHNHEVKLIEGDSLSINTLQKVKEEVDQISLLLIDGQHSFSNILNEYNLYAPLVANGGIIFFDNYGNQFHTGAKYAVDSIDKTDWYIIGQYGYGFFMQKK